MTNEVLKTFILRAVQIAQPLLGKDIYALIDDGLEIGHYHIEEFVMEDVTDKNINVYADSHSRLVNGYNSDDVGYGVFGTEHEAYSGLHAVTFDWSEETKTLSDVFQQLSNLSDQKIDRTVFCVLLDESSNKFNVTAMPLYDLMISGSTYHYKDLMDNDREFKRNGILVACKTRDEIGSFTGVFGERCFLDSEHAWQKAQTMNKEHTER